MESFNGRLKDKFLNVEMFASLTESIVLAEQHRIAYISYRPQSALMGRTPMEVI